MNKKQIKYDFLNRRDVTEDRMALLRAQGPECFGLLLDLLVSDQLTELQTINGMIYLFGMQRAQGVTETQLCEYAHLLTRLARSQKEEIRNRARVQISAIVALSEESDAPLYDSSTLGELRAALFS